MANNIKYSSSPDLISLRSGNFSLGVDPSQEYAFTWQTDYFNGFEVKEGTYVIYTFNQFYLDLYNCAIKTYIAHSDEDLVAYLSTVRGEVMTGVKESLLWANSDPNVIVFSSSVIDTLTEGLVLDLDGSQEASLPRSGGGWYARYTAAGTFTWYADGDGTDVILQGSGVSSQQHLWLGTFRNGSSELRLDGGQVASNPSAPTGTTMPTNPTAIGRYASSEYFNNGISEIVYMPRDLEPVKVAYETNINNYFNTFE